MSRWQCIVKRVFDLCFAAFGLAAFGWLIFICWLIATIETRQNGFYTQERVGKEGRLFRIIKIRTMRTVEGLATVVTSRNDSRITWAGAWMRRLKLDELPQLVNVLLGQMSFVGPRPDVPGFADQLMDEDRAILSIRPGVTGPATLAFRNEEELFANCGDPEQYNRDVVFPAKVKINRLYIENYSFRKDLLYIIATVIPVLKAWILPELELKHGS